MIYITGQHALNLPCSLNTCGDWHKAALKWENITFADSTGMFFRDYGIEHSKMIPNHPGTFCVANHIRALLDLMEMGNFSIAQGMNNDYICNEEYDDEIFQLVITMNKLPNWSEIDKFMEKEYRLKWVNFKSQVSI